MDAPLSGPIMRMHDEPRFILGPKYRIAYYEFLHALIPPTSARPHAELDTLVSEPRQGRAFLLRPLTECRCCGGPFEHLQRCPAGPPNLVIPAYDLKLWWYGPAMRGAWSNRPITIEQLRRVLLWAADVERPRQLAAS